METKQQVIERQNLYSLPINQIYEQYHVNPKEGLTHAQVKEHVKKYGMNELKKVERSFIKVIIAPIINLLIIIYLLSALAMALLGEITRTVPTFLIVGFNAIVAIIQQFRAEKQLQALQKLSEANTQVIREGNIVEIPNSDVVVGDIVQLRTGDKVPADCRILEARNLTVDESSLTGESEPVSKLSDAIHLEGKNLPLQKQMNMLFMGTFISSGNCKAIIVRVGQLTEIGKISQKLEETTTGEIPLRNKMNHVAKYLGIGVVILLILSIIWRSYVLFHNNPFDWDEFKQALILSIDLGMKVMPINLPVLTTIVLLTGVLVMAQKGVIIREISRTESLGRVSVVCTDKTGTLTKNEMTVQKIWTYNKEYRVEGTGFQPKGNIYAVNSNNVLEPLESPTLDTLIISGYLNNNSQLYSEQVKVIGKQKLEETWKITGLPTEAALKVVAQKYDPSLEQRLQNTTLIHEFSFSSDLKRMSQLYQFEGKPVLFSKGSTEQILSLSNQVQIGNEVQPIDNEKRTRINQAMQRYAEQGFRILSIAIRNLLNEPQLLENIHDEDARSIFEKNLTYLGFVVIYDPPRADVKQAIQECKSAGIQTIMITGDNLITAKAIGKELEIYNPETDLATEGHRIEELPFEDFKRTTVFARVSPEHKQIIVERYKAHKQIVAMSGDGVNDALALSLADCGVAMGIQGTEVAKEAADMIITDDSFSTIVTGIREGRGLFEKIRAIIYFFVCVSVMEAIILFTSTINPSNPFFEMWSYWQLNLLYLTAHMFPSLGFTFGTYSKEIMKEPPRDSAEIITKRIMQIMSIQMLLMGLAITISYYFSLWGWIGLNETNFSHGTFLNENEAIIGVRQIKARTMAYVVLFFLESFIMPLQIRRLNDPIEKSLKDITYWKEFLFYIPSVAILAVIIYSIPLQEFLGRTLNQSMNFTQLSVGDWIICFGLSLPAILAFEGIRRLFWKKNIRF